MPVDLTALRTEIESDPQGLGYAPLMARGSDADVADLLNAPRPGAAYVVFRPDVPVKDVVEAKLKEYVSPDITVEEDKG